jgi:excisionase family DNA binding protein
MDNLISVQEAARRLGVSFWTIYRWTQEGRMPCVHLGRRRLIAESDLQSLINKARTTGQQPQEFQRHQKGTEA